MAGPSDSRKFIWPNDINSGCFQLHISQNVARSMPSLTSQSCGNSLLAVCLTRQVGAIYRLGLGNILIYRQYRNTGVCNNRYRRLFHMSIISLMQYIAEYCNISQCCTIGLRTQNKYASIILKNFSAVTLLILNTSQILYAILAIIAMCL